MIKLLLEPANLLILDEPTNHLDMRSKDVLKDALKEFDGTVILVSHDREFLSGLVDKVYEFGNKRVREHLGGISEFLERKKIENLSELERKKNVSLESKSKDNQLSENKLSYEERKEQQRLLRKLEKNVSECEEKIEKLEIEIKSIEQQLSTPEGASNVDLLMEYAKKKEKLSHVMEKWTECTMELESQTSL